MKYFIASVALVLGLALLAACGGGGEPEATATPVATAAPAVASPTTSAVPTISLAQLKAEVKERLTSCELSLLMPHEAGQRIPQYSDCAKLRKQYQDLEKYGYILPIDE